jgi:LacI family transcriptional regulator
MTAKPTVHDVAARADLSIATVSRALNGLPVSREARAKVTKAAAALGYVANEAARALRSDRTLTVGVIFFNLSNTLGIELLDALGETIEGDGYSLLVASARGSAERYDLLMHRFLERRVDGLFCIAPRGEGDTIARYQSASIPVVALFSRAGDYADLPLLQPSFSDSAKDLAAHLASKGHRRVALLSTAPSPALDAIHAALKREDIAVEPITPPESGGTRDVIATLAARKNRPTVIIAPDPLVRGMDAATAAAGLRIPQDLALVAIGETRADSHFIKHDVSALTVDPHHMGRAAGAAMLAWLTGTPPPARTQVQAATFTARGSTAR